MIARHPTRALVTLASVAMLLVYGGDALAGLFGPPVDNASFESPVTATADTNVTDWFEEQENNASFLGGFVINEGQTGMPVTPHGSQWLELISNTNTPGAVYQQIGTWDPNVTLTFSSLIGNRNLLTDADYEVQLWAGGTPGSAANNISLTTLGATAIDTTGPIALVGNGLTESRSFDLSTGSGYTTGDALWLQLKQIAPSGSLANNSVTLFDNVSVTVNATPPTSVIENGSFETPGITTGNNLTRVDGWFEEAEGSTLGGFVVDLPEAGSPAPPDGSQWLELLSDPNTAGVVYQQIGTFNDSLLGYDVDMVVGNRDLLGDSNYAAELWAGGDPALADIGTSLTALGASLVDTTGELTIPANGLTELVSFDLLTGMGLSPGDPLWLRLTQVGQGGTLGTNDAVLFDSISATPNFAAVPEPRSVLLWGVLGAVMGVMYRFSRRSNREQFGHSV